MFQKTVNKALKKEAFKLPNMGGKGKFFYLGYEQNPYTDYLTKPSKTSSPSNVLKAVLYTIASHGTTTWNLTFVVPFKDPRKLPPTLKKKMLSSLDKIMMGLIENNCLDYHILNVPFSKYPLDVLIDSILEVYPILYFNKDLKPDELKKLASISPNRLIVIDGKSSIDLVPVKEPAKGMSFPKNAMGLTQLFLAIGKIPEIKDPKVLQKLASILKCK